MTQASHAYVAMGKIKDETWQIFVALLIFLSFQSLFILHIDVFAIPIRRLISTEHPPWFDIIDPRKLNWSKILMSSFPS